MARGKDVERFLEWQPIWTDFYLLGGRMGTNPMPAPKNSWQSFVDFLWNHRAKFTFIGMVLFTTFVHSLPMSIHSSPFLTWAYGWLYSFAHALSGGLGTTINPNAAP
jgi:hypothetical protein